MDNKFYFYNFIVVKYLFKLLFSLVKFITPRLNLNILNKKIFISIKYGKG